MVACSLASARGSTVADGLTALLLQLDVPPAAGHVRPTSLRPGDRFLVARKPDAYRRDRSADAVHGHVSIGDRFGAVDHAATSRPPREPRCASSLRPAPATGTTPSAGRTRASSGTRRPVFISNSNASTCRRRRPRASAHGTGVPDHSRPRSRSTPARTTRGDPGDLRRSPRCRPAQRRSTPPAAAAWYNTDGRRRTRTFRARVVGARRAGDPRPRARHSAHAGHRCRSPAPRWRAAPSGCSRRAPLQSSDHEERPDE